MIVQVTQRHIDEGQRGDCVRCATSLAVTDAVAELEGISTELVFTTTFAAYALICTAVLPAPHAKPRRVYNLYLIEPEIQKVRDFIGLFDRGLVARPFEFEAELV